MKVKKNIKGFLSIFKILLLTGIVLGFTGCEQPGSEPSPSLKYYVYEGQISGGTRNIVVTVYENGTKMSFTYASEPLVAIKRQ